MTLRNTYGRLALLAVGLLAGARGASAQVYSQCPGPTPASPNPVCLHLAAGDGFVKMADGHLQYIFGFQDVTGVVDSQVMTTAELGAQFSAPTLVMDEVHRCLPCPLRHAMK